LRMPRNETRQSQVERVIVALNKRLLVMSGYAEPQIRKLGDLAELSTDELLKLLTRNSMSKRPRNTKIPQSTKVS
jgi:hypothetical protein